MLLGIEQASTANMQALTKEDKRREEINTVGSSLFVFNSLPFPNPCPSLPPPVRVCLQGTAQTNQLTM